MNITPIANDVIDSLRAQVYDYETIRDILELASSYVQEELDHRLLAKIGGSEELYKFKLAGFTATRAERERGGDITVYLTPTRED